MNFTSRPLRCVLGSALLTMVTGSCMVKAQTSIPTATPNAKPDPTQSSAVQSPAATQQPCAESEPLISLDQYHGPFQKTVVYLGRKLERKTTHRPHYQPGISLCSLTAGEKFRLFVNDTIEPVSFIAAGIAGGIAQATDADESFGQGSAGYGKRYGAAFADQAADNFFREFFYPALFREDPRYYRMAHGSSRRRLGHALRHTFVATSDSGRNMFNFSEWFGTASAQVLSNTYHPDNSRGFASAAEGTAIRLCTDMGFDVLREFLPDIFRKLNLPFLRPEHHTNHHNSSTPAAPPKP